MDLHSQAGPSSSAALIVRTGVTKHFLCAKSSYQLTVLMRPIPITTHEEGTDSIPILQTVKLRPREAK